MRRSRARALLSLLAVLFAIADGAVVFAQGGGGSTGQGGGQGGGGGAARGQGPAVCQVEEDRRAADKEAIIAACTRLMAAGALNKEAHANALLARAAAYHGLKRYDEAVGDLTQALTIKPGTALFHHERGNALKEKGLVAEAIVDFDQALKLNPNFVLAHFGRAEARAAAGQREAAIADFNQVLALPAGTTRRDLRAREVALQKLTQLGVVQLGKRIALVIGNSRYQGQSVLTNPRNDAQAMAAKLRGLGFADVTEYHDLALPALTAALKQLGDAAAAADWAMIYYAGHGIEVDGVNYLIPIDARLASDTHVKDEAISLDRVLEKVQGSRKLRLVVLDACRNNPFARTMTRSAGTRSISRGLADIEPVAGVQVIYAAKHGSEALDGAGANSPFTQALLRHLDEPALDLALLVGRVRETVLRETRSRQEPWMYGAPSSERHYFRLN